MKNRYLYIGLLLSILTTGCSQFEELAPTQEPKTTGTRAGTTTFEALPNPYALDVMQDIYDDFDGDIILQPTHLYVRFKPLDETQINWLRDSGLELFDYPLDVNIPDGVEYVDPTIPEGERA